MSNISKAVINDYVNLIVLDAHSVIDTLSAIEMEDKGAYNKMIELMGRIVKRARFIEEWNERT